MSDYEEEREIVDVENDDEASVLCPIWGGLSAKVDFSCFLKVLDKRAHHNALERKRRDHIKDSFTNLRDAIPEIAGEKVWPEIEWIWSPV